jgi:hypothetical protein
MAWALFELAKRPDIVQRLRKEILDTVGPTAAPTYSDLKGMKFLNHVINETLRLYPAVPFNVRVALKDTSLPTGGGPDGLDVYIPHQLLCPVRVDTDWSSPLESWLVRNVLGLP